MTLPQVSAAAACPRSTAVSRAVVAAWPTSATLAFERRGCRDVPPGPAFERCEAWRPGGASGRATTRPRGACWPRSCCGARGPAAFRAWVAADLAETLRKRLVDVRAARQGDGERSDCREPRVSASPAPAPATRCKWRWALRLKRHRASRRQGAHRRRHAGRPRDLVDAAGCSGRRDRAPCRHACDAAADDWHWFGIRAGVPVITGPRRTSSSRRRRTGTCRRRQFPQGMLSGPGNRRAHAVSRPLEGAPLCVPRRQRRRPRPATPLYHAAFGNQACGTVVNAAAAPEGGSDLLAVVQWNALAERALHLGAPDGPALAPLPLPYDVPAPVRREPRPSCDPRSPITTSGIASPAIPSLRARRSMRCSPTCSCTRA